MAMKKLFLTSIATLFLVTGTAHATEDGCAVVLKTPDGFLNVRAQANARSHILKRLRPGQVIYTDTAGGDGDEKRYWTHVYLEYARPRPRWGWVRNRFIIEINCDDLIAPTTSIWGFGSPPLPPKSDRPTDPFQGMPSTPIPLAQVVVQVVVVVM